MNFSLFFIIFYNFPGKKKNSFLVKNGSVSPVFGLSISFLIRFFRIIPGSDFLWLSTE